MQKEFLPFLTDSQGRSLKVKNGVVTNPGSVIPDPLDDAPEGWEKNTIQFSRNNEFKGMIKSYTTPLKFFLEGATILRHYYYTFGLEVIMFFIWLKMDLNFGQDQKYKGWYKGEPDLSTFKDLDDGVEIQITEGGLFKELQSGKKNESEYPLDNSEAVSLENDGMSIQQKVNYLVTDGTLDSNYGQHVLDMQIISVERNSEFSANSVDRRYFANNGELSSGIPFHETGTSATNLHIKGSFGFHVGLAPGIPPNPAAGSLLLVREFDLNNNVTNAYPIQNFGGANNLYLTHWISNFDTVINIPANRKLYFCHFLTIGGVIASGSGADQVVYWNYDNSEKDYIELDYLYRAPSTIYPCFKAYDLGNEIIKKISENKSTLKSDLLMADDNLLITSGDAIRGITDSLIKTTWSDYHKSIDSLRCISFGIENNNGRLEERKFAYQNNFISNLGSSKNLTIQPANEYIYSGIENGYPIRDIGEANGKFVFCSRVFYSTPMKRLSNVYDIMSIYLADPFIIEIMRINLDRKTTTDSKTDNDVFFFDAERVYPNPFNLNIECTAPNQIRILGTVALSWKAGMKFKISNGLNAKAFTIRNVTEISGNTEIITVEDNVNTEAALAVSIEMRHYKLRRKPYVTIEGIPSPETVYNLELSPKSNLKYHYEWIYSAMELMDGKKIIWETTDKNDKVSRIDAAGATIKEKEDIVISAVVLGAKIYRPHYLIFNAESSLNLLEQMTNSGGLGYFIIDTFKGYPEDIKTNDTTNETQEYKLLITGDSDLIPLIKR